MVRVKKRYIVLKVNSKKNKLDPETIKKEVRDRVCQTYGDYGVACLNRGCTVKRQDAQGGNMIICVRKGVHEMVMSVLPLIVSIDHMPCSVSILHLSGTMRGCLKVLKQECIQSLRENIAKRTPQQCHSSVEIYRAPKQPPVKEAKRRKITKKTAETLDPKEIVIT